jgi:hypothetical protein
MQYFRSRGGFTNSGQPEIVISYLAPPDKGRDVWQGMQVMKSNVEPDI